MLYRYQGVRLVFFLDHSMGVLLNADGQQAPSVSWCLLFIIFPSRIAPETALSLSVYQMTVPACRRGVSYFVFEYSPPLDSPAERCSVLQDFSCQISSFPTGRSIKWRGVKPIASFASGKQRQLHQLGPPPNIITPFFSRVLRWL